MQGSRKILRQGYKNTCLVTGAFLRKSKLLRSHQHETRIIVMVIRNLAVNDLKVVRRRPKSCTDSSPALAGIVLHNFHSF
ncbi:hypothetical protein D3C81_2025200 [compost metagenome]